MLKSPGGSLFPYYYKGGELHCLKYGSFFKDEKSLFDLMEKEKDFILKQNFNLNIWVDFYETKISNNVILKFYENILSISGRINRLAIVGLSMLSKIKLNGKLKQLKFPVKYFMDPENAKTWIVTGKS